MTFAISQHPPLESILISRKGVQCIYYGFSIGLSIKAMASSASSVHLKITVSLLLYHRLMKKPDNSIRPLQYPMFLCNMLLKFFISLKKGSSDLTGYTRSRVDAVFRLNVMSYINHKKEKNYMKTMMGIIVCLIILFAPPVSHAEKVIMATGEWIPFTSANLEQYGKFSERVNIVFKEMGIEPEFRFYPWRRCYESVIKGRVWAAFPYSITSERAEEVWYSDLLACSRTSFFYYEQKKAGKQYQFKDLQNLKKYRVGGVIGYYYEEVFQEAGLDIDYVNKEISGLEKLKIGRIDLMPFNELVGWHLINKHFPNEANKFKVLARPLDVSSLHLIVSKEYPRSKELLDRFNAALKRCVEKGLLLIPKCQ